MAWIRKNVITACPHQPWHGGEGETVVTVISLLMLLSLFAGVLEDAGITASDLERAATYYKGLAEGGEKVADEDPVPKAFCWWTEASENGSSGNWPTWPWSSNAESARAALRGEAASSPRLRLLSGKYRTKRCVLVPFHDTGKM